MPKSERELIRVELWRLVARLVKRCGGRLPTFTDVVLVDDAVLTVAVRRATESEIREVIK